MMRNGISLKPSSYSTFKVSSFQRNEHDLNAAVLDWDGKVKGIYQTMSPLHKLRRCYGRYLRAGLLSL
jgi:hypothetical protein